jgi:hypothetical protein
MTRSFAVLSMAGMLAAVGAYAADLTAVPTAQPKVAGDTAPNVLSPELAEKIVAQGATPLENPSADFPFYGYEGNGPLLPSLGSNVEATKTEPDKNTYLVLHGLNGPDKLYDYGKRFLYQGHELGKGYITRINLDADYAHRVTLLATTDTDNKPLPPLDGSTWYPWSHRLLFSFESASAGGVWQATPGFPSIVDHLAAFGHAAYEGMQADPHGEIWVIEDAGGKNGSGAFAHARQPNSFIFRFIPKDKSDLTKGGKLQALQVLSKAHAGAIVFNAADVNGDIGSQDQHDLHTYGKAFDTRWVTIHDTELNGAAKIERRDAVQAAGKRSVPSGQRFPGILLRCDRRHQRGHGGG